VLGFYGGAGGGCHGRPLCIPLMRGKLDVATAAGTHVLQMEPAKICNFETKEKTLHCLNQTGEGFPFVLSTAISMACSY
jgi:hypothetical protein